MDKGRPRKHEPSYGEGEHWGVDPHDVRRHARRMREAKAAGPLGRFFRVAVLALLAAGAVAVFWNFETLRDLRFDASGLTSLFRGDAPRGARVEPGGEPGTEVVGDSGVAGVSMPTSLDGDTPEPNPPSGDAPASETAAAPGTEPAAQAAPPAAQAGAPAGEGASPAAAPSPAAEPAPAAATAADASANAPRAAPALPEPEPEPEAPPAPETLGFGLSVMHVSEADATAAVLVLRDGGRRGVSPFTWWTVDGTAGAGSDFARLEPRVERFATGEQNRTIYVPIVGDRSAEGPESFYVRVVAGESRNTDGPIAEIEVVIDDDD